MDKLYIEENVYICGKNIMRWQLTLFFIHFCNLLCFAQTIDNPVFDRSSFEVLRPHVDKVEITKNATKIYCSIFHQGIGNFKVPKTMFLEDTYNKKRYQIKDYTGPLFETEEQVSTYEGKDQFVFCFSHVDNLHEFNLIEDSSKDSSFNIYGINISTSYQQTFDETEYQRLKNMSDFYKSSGDLSKQIDFRKKELSAAQFIYGMKSLAANLCYIQLANNYNEAGDYKNAIDMGLQALECDSIQFGVVNKENPIYANTLGSLSQFYHNAGKETESIQYALRGITIRKLLDDENGYTNDLYNLLLTWNTHEEILKRIAIVQKELKSLPGFIDNTSLSLVKIYKQIAFMYSIIDDNKNALDYCNKAVIILESNEKDNSTNYAELLALECKCQKRIGLKNEAVTSGEAAKILYEILDNSSTKYAELLDDLAWVYGSVLNYEKSIELQNIAAEIYQKNEDWISLAEAYQSISHYYQNAEKLDDAEQSIKKAINVLNEHDNAELHIQNEIKLTGNPLINTTSYLKVIELRINTAKANLLQTLARIYQKQGKNQESIATELENGKILKNLDGKWYASHLITLSEYYSNNNQQDKAIACAEQSLQILTGNKKKSLALQRLAYIYYQKGVTERAIHYLEESISISKSFNDNDITINSLSLLSYYHWKNNNIKEAEHYLSDALDFLRDSISNELVEMSAEQKQRLWSKYEHLFLLYRNIIEKSDRNASLMSKLFDYVLFSKSLLLDTDIDANRLKITWKDIQKQLKDEDIAIEFISTIEDDGNYNTYHALIVDKHSPSPTMITLYSETNLEELKKTTSRQFHDIVGELLWKPIISQYNMAKNIYFSPDRILNLLPIEYFNVGSNKNMFEYYNMYRLSSTKELIRNNHTPKHNKAVLYGGLDYNQLKEQVRTKNNRWRGIKDRGGFEPLFNTLDEIKEIESLLVRSNISTTLFSGKNGTEDSFLDLSSQNINMMHLATHGMYISPNSIDIKKKENNFDFLESLTNQDDPVREDVFLTHSFLVMSGGNKLIQRETLADYESDGILTAKEISHLNLKDLDLVVLSACESALGDVNNSGVYGLQRGFKKAGANTILMSLEKVDDEATRILMVEFYRNLISGKTKLQSLREAQHHLRQVENGKYNDPKYWASFIMLDGLN